MATRYKLISLKDKASGAELDASTDDAKFATALALKDAHNVPSVVPGTSGYVLMSNGTDWVSAGPAGSSPLVVAKAYPDEDYILIQDQKAQNTQGGTFSSGAWRTRDLNTEVSDDGGHASVASNQITLVAGTYRCYISAPTLRVDNSQAILYNVSGSVVTLIGTSVISNNASGTGGLVCSIIMGQFTIASSTIFEVQHRCLTTYNTYGFGGASNLGVEVYTSVEFWRKNDTQFITGVAGSSYLPNGTAQYQIPVTGATPFAPVYSGFLLDGTTGGKTNLAVTSGKTLTLTAADNYNLTVPVTGTAALINVANNGDIKLSTSGNGLYIKEGANATIGIVTLVLGVAVVNTTKVTANSRILLTTQGGTLTNIANHYISARTPGTSFTITSMNLLDTSDVAWLILEPA